MDNNVGEASLKSTQDSAGCVAMKWPRNNTVEMTLKMRGKLRVLVDGEEWI